MKMPMLNEYSSIKNFCEAVQLWQVVEMKNTCTICHGDNIHTKCDACGWWGKVAPTKKETLQNIKKHDWSELINFQVKP